MLGTLFRLFKKKLFKSFNTYWKKSGIDFCLSILEFSGKHFHYEKAQELVLLFSFCMPVPGSWQRMCWHGRLI